MGQGWISRYVDGKDAIAEVGGLEGRVNGSFERNWRVLVGSPEYVLPPSGFVCSGPGPTLIYSARLGDGRVDYRSTPAVRFVDARGTKQRVSEVETDGAAILRKRTEEGWAVWPLGNTTLLRVNCRALGLPTNVTVASFGEDGEALGAVETATEDEWLSLSVDLGAFRFELIPGR